MTLRSLLCLTLVAGAAAAVRAEERLEWKLSTGDALKYAVQNEMATTQTVGTFENQTRLIQTMHMGWNVQTVTAARQFVVEQVIERIRVEVVPGQGDAIVFDSGQGDTPDDPIVRSLANVFRKLVNRKFNVTMGATGSIDHVVIPDDLLATLKAAAAGSAGGLDENSLKQMLSQTAVVLPQDSVQSGDQWTSEQSVNLGFATLKMNATMTYKGRNDDGLSVIDYVPTVELEPNASADIQMKLKASEGQGTVLFDSEAGRVVRMQLKLQMDMVTAVRGQQVRQKINQQTIMQLQK